MFFIGYYMYLFFQQMFLVKVVKGKTLLSIFENFNLLVNNNNYYPLFKINRLYVFSDLNRYKISLNKRKNATNWVMIQDRWSTFDFQITIVPTVFISFSRIVFFSDLNYANYSNLRNKKTFFDIILRVNSLSKKWNYVFHYSPQLILIT